MPVKKSDTQKTITFGDRLHEEVEALQVKLGLPSFAETVRHIVFEFFRDRKKAKGEVV